MSQYKFKFFRSSLSHTKSSSTWVEEHLHLKEMLLKQQKRTCIGISPTSEGQCHPWAASAPGLAKLAPPPHLQIKSFNQVECWVITYIRINCLYWRLLRKWLSWLCWHWLGDHWQWGHKSHVMDRKCRPFNWLGNYLVWTEVRNWFSYDNCIPQQTSQIG